MASELRFFKDAEFVQSLANIDYVVWLSKQGYFDQSAFVNYLEYLMYFREPEYAIHLSYTRGLEVLELLRDPKIRELLREDPITFRRILMDQLWCSWARKAEIDIH
jgi:mediator of RNA polymerase II transcription subunit 31